MRGRSARGGAHGPQAGAPIRREAERHLDRLRKVFLKLGVSPRIELAHVPLGTLGDAPPPVSA